MMSADLVPLIRTTQFAHFPLSKSPALKSVLKIADDLQNSVSKMIRGILRSVFPSWHKAAFPLAGMSESQLDTSMEGNLGFHRLPQLPLSQIWILLALLAT